MRQLMLPKKSQRQLGLISFFFRNRGQRYNYKDIAAETDNASSVVFADLHEIDRIFNPKIQLISHGKSGVSLVIQPHLSYNYFFKIYAKESLEFQLLDNLFKEKYTQINDAVVALFVSRTTIIRILNQMNEFFDRRGIGAQIDKSTMNLTMNERVYRHFYPMFVDAFYHLNEWPFPSVTYSEIHEFMGRFAKVSPFFKASQNYPTPYITIASNIEEYLKGKYVTNEDANLSIEKTEKLLEAVDSEDCYISVKGNKIDLDGFILQQLLISLASDKTILHSDCIDPKYFNNQDYYQNFTHFLKQIDQLAKKYQLKSITQEDICLIGMKVHNYCYTNAIMRELFSDTNPVYFGDLQKIIQSINSEFVEDLKQIIDDYTQNAGNIDKNDAVYKEFILYVMLTSWPNITTDLGQRCKPVKLLIYTGNRGLDSKICETIRPVFQSNIEIQVAEESIDWSQSHQLPQDAFIISDRLPYIEGKPCYVFTTFDDPEMIRWVSDTTECIIAQRLQYNNQ